MKSESDRQGDASCCGDLLDFGEFRRSGRPLADKTALVQKLARTERCSLFLRPDGFGKSFLVAQLESLFRDGLKDFHGLEIEKTWRDKAGYIVLRLDFSRFPDFETKEEFEERFRSVFSAACARLGRPLEQRTPFVSYDLEFWLAACELGSVVLLADGLDAPLLQALGKPDLFQAVWSAIDDFLSLVKSRDGCFRFVFLTGVTNFLALDPFSSFNHCNNLSYEEDWAGLLGFSTEEVKRCFGGPLARAAQALNLSQDEVVRQLEEAQGGHLFAGGEKPNPMLPAAAVLRFLEHPEAGFDAVSAGDAARRILDFLKARRETLEDVELVLDEWDLREPLSSDDCSTAGLLAQAGLLTIKAWEANTVWLAPPNRTAERLLATLKS